MVLLTLFFFGMFIFVILSLIGDFTKEGEKSKARKEGKIVLTHDELYKHVWKMARKVQALNTYPYSTGNSLYRRQYNYWVEYCEYLADCASIGCSSFSNIYGVGNMLPSGEAMRIEKEVLEARKTIPGIDDWLPAVHLFTPWTDEELETYHNFSNRFYFED